MRNEGDSLEKGPSLASTGKTPPGGPDNAFILAVSLGMLAPRRRTLAYPEEHLQQRLGDLGMPLPTGLSSADSSRLREWPAQSNLAAEAPSGLGLAQQGEGKAELPLPQGLGRWPRHFSDPQAFYRSPYTRQ